MAKQVKQLELVGLAVLVIGLAAGIFSVQQKQKIQTRAATYSCTGTWTCTCTTGYCAGQGKTGQSYTYNCSNYSSPNSSTCTGGGDGQGNYCQTANGWTRSGGCSWSGGGGGGPIIWAPTCADWTNVRLNDCRSTTDYANKTASCVTTSSTVKIYNNVYVPPGGFTVMSFRNEAPTVDCASIATPGWSEPQVVAGEANWNLSPGNGEKQVCAKFKNDKGWAQCGGKIRKNSPPTCTLTGPTSVGYPTLYRGIYAASCADADNNLTKIELYRTPVGSENWAAAGAACQFSPSGSSSCSRTIQFPGPGNYYVTVNGYDSTGFGGWCSGNPWCEWLPNNPPTTTHNCSGDLGFSDCGPSDLLVVTVK